MTLVLCLLGRGRSGACARSMAAGIEHCGARVELAHGWNGDLRADVLVSYGWSNRRIFEAYRAAGKPFVYLDMGFWNRKPLGAVYRGHHKVVVSARDAFAYFRRGHRSDRWHSLKVPLRPWRERGEHILLAGMSAKSARLFGYEPQAWERKAVARIRRYGNRPIVYRPKPASPGAGQIAGTILGNPQQPLEADLADAWAVVTHHSNVGLEALAAGIPVYSEDGLASTMSMALEQIEDPPLPKDREGFFADVAYCQWNADEMESGACWRHLQAEGLVPCSL